ncbi:PREDICTED: coiled-coil domain-containing protein 149 [Papilio xuthus]|uniref:Coiled-coil domain-containing protein 149 n=1 Tax=Papilio xuthus TaxID=66420 RepID=A0AAJ7EDR0_PAPXU|nr:PREDICTED: coiled-coil domain-containing protein 149 [Papilio xuthus]
MFNKSKVQFQDQQLDDYVLENSVLKSKLQSKVDALGIMSKELDKCSMERDRYKILVEQLQCKKSVSICVQDNNNYRFTQTNTISGGEILARTREHNNMLKLEVETLRSKLEEANGDIMALRRQLQKGTLLDENDVNKKTLQNSQQKDYEQLVQNLEKIQNKYQQLRLDYRTTLDEKEELVADRDYYKNKVQRLNHQISYFLTNKNVQHDSELDQPKPIVDIDALVTENKYLHERITQLQVEKEIVKRTLTKYKTLLDNRSKGDTVNIKRGFADVMTQKQVREYLDTNSKTGLKRSSAAELKSLCLGLFEALNDKSIALQHQRKTNQILANRINELEKTLESWCNGQKCIPIFPSQMLLEEFLPDTSSVKSDEKNNKVLEDSEVKIQNTYSDSEEDFGTFDNETISFGDNYTDGGGDRHVSKTILPLELEQLVKEALADLKPVQ